MNEFVFLRVSSSILDGLPEQRPRAWFGEIVVDLQDECRRCIESSADADDVTELVKDLMHAAVDLSCAVANADDSGQDDFTQEIGDVSDAIVKLRALTPLPEASRGQPERSVGYDDVRRELGLE